METSFDKALANAKKATENDTQGNYADALSDYKLASEYFLHSLKYETIGGVKKAAIVERVKEYVKRAEELEAIVHGQKTAKVSVGGSGDTDYSRIKAGIEKRIIEDKERVEWSDIAGLDGAKQALQEAVIIPSKFPQLFSENRRPWKGILLFGPPGTGKTQLAKAVASEANNATFISVTSSDLISKWLGESEKQIKALFEVARERSPSVIFIDEIDSLCSTRTDTENEATKRVKTEILAQMQGVREDHTNVLVLGATNNPWILDAAVRRRFEKRIYIPPPDYKSRSELFRIRLQKIMNTEINHQVLDLFANMTDGYSGHDICSAINEANYEPIRLIQHSTHFKRVSGPSPTDPNIICNDLYVPCSPGESNAIEMSLTDIKSDKLICPPVTISHVRDAIKRTKPSISSKDMEKHIEFKDVYGMTG